MSASSSSQSSSPSSSSETLPDVPPIVGGTSLLVAWQLKGKRVLIVGGGEVASGRIESILAADASIVLLSPSKGVSPRTRQYIDLYPDRITYYDRRFTGPAELHKIDMVLTALDDSTRSREIVEMCRQQKIPVNAADIPDLCDFFYGAQIRDGPLHILISTNGSGPRIAALIKEKLKDALSGLEGEAITRVGELRERVKQRAPGIGGPVGRKRMKWMTKLCNEWTLEEFTLLTDATMEKMISEGWDKGKVPSPQEVGVKPKGKTSEPEFPTSLWPALAGFVVGAVVMTSLLALKVRR